jgi:oligosaccharide repeat unit polymerase
VEANWLMLMVLACVTFVAIYISRVLFKRWFNPLSLYSFVWGFGLCCYELRLIQYERISLQAWVYIATAWVSIFLGAATILFIQGSKARRIVRGPQVNLNHLKWAILLLSSVSFIGLLDEIWVMTRQFGGLYDAIIANAGELYLSRSSAEVAYIPYVGAFAYAACSLSGAYMAFLGRVTLLGLFPILLMTAMQIFAMSRIGLAIAALLFLASYLLARKDIRLRITRWQRILAFGLGAMILSSGFVLVSTTRGLGVDFPGKTPALEAISDYIPVFPSLYSAVSASPVAFSMYLAAPEASKTRRWGQYTFAPVLRFLSKLGFPTYVERLEENYYTPVHSNVSTYLKNVDSDFGLMGIVLFPYILGLVATFISLRIDREFRLLDIVLLSNLYIIVAFSFFFNLMYLGDWYVSLLVGTFSAYFLRRRIKSALGSGYSISFSQRRSVWLDRGASTGHPL